MAVFSNILDLAGINAPILFKEHQQKESPEESPAAADRGAEDRIHRGKSRHKVCSSGSNHRSSRRQRTGGCAGPKEVQTEPNARHLKCHKFVCGHCARRAEVICRLRRVITTALCFCFRAARFQLFRLLLFNIYY